MGKLVRCEFAEVGWKRWWFWVGWCGYWRCSLENWRKAGIWERWRRWEGVVLVRRWNTQRMGEIGLHVSDHGGEFGHLTLEVVEGGPVSVETTTDGTHIAGNSLAQLGVFVLVVRGCRCSVVPGITRGRIPRGGAGSGTWRHGWWRGKGGWDEPPIDR
jgi:hypothetical protein